MQSESWSRTGFLRADASEGEIRGDGSPEISILREYGNQTSAALPIALGRGVDCRRIGSGDKLVLLGFDSVNNSLFLDVEW